jgi:hypothetical protein
MISKHAALAAATLAFIVCAPSADAQQVLSREAGAVELVFLPWEAPPQPRSLRSGEVAWEETLIVPDAVRLEKDVASRVRPPAQPVTAGTLLYGYQLRGGVAYCVPFDLSGGYVRPVQCFRDFNDDGIFDGAYVAQSLHRSTRAFPRHVYGLIGQRGATNYTRLQPIEGLRIPARVIFEGMSGGAPRLRLDTFDHVGDGDEDRDCVLVEPGVCTWSGLRIRFNASADGAVELMPEPPAQGRGFLIRMDDAR